MDIKKQPDILLIDWIDSCSTSGWQHSNDCKAEMLMTCQTVGFFVDETKDRLCVGLNRTTKEGFTPFGELITIPKVAIKRKRKLKIK